MPSAASSEITPTAKQIVFLLMAATVVAVVVFLCGVLVGRDLPVDGGSILADGSDMAMTYDLPTATLSSPSSEPSAAAGHSAELTYYRRLVGSQAAPDVLRLGSSGGASDVDTSLTRVPDGDHERSNTPELGEQDIHRGSVEAQAQESQLLPSVSELASVAPATDGYSVQVMALRSLMAAREVVTRLSDKGFPATVVLPEADAPSALFRVRVGPYEDRAEAQRIMGRLETEEQFEAFVTR